MVYINDLCFLHATQNKNLHPPTVVYNNYYVEHEILIWRMCDNNAKLIHPLCVLIEISCLMLLDTIMQNKISSLIEEIQVANNE